MDICALFSGSRGKTIFRLFANVVLYIAVFFFLIKTLEYLGFSPTVIAAGIGSMALAISLGAQNFVADIFAGLTYVFEGTVHVGDNVQIAITGSPPYQGRVVEVGVRCIKVLTREGGFITCFNRDIKTIQNNTQMNSHVICELVVSSEISADELEQVLRTELPAIGRTDGRILSGPVYNGITTIGKGTMTLSVSAECSEENYFYVRDKLNSSLQRIFKEHGYSI
jgi:small-conductance mechanosensitive channel